MSRAAARAADSAPLDKKRQAALRAQCHHARQFDVAARPWPEAPPGEPAGKNGQAFCHRKAGADTGPGATTERNVLESVASFLAFGREALRIEPVGIGPQCPMAVNQPGPDRD